MFSKLQIYCEAIMEASWLAAAVIIPLFFNVSSSQTFEPDKAYVLTFLAIISGARVYAETALRGRAAESRRRLGSSVSLDASS